MTSLLIFVASFALALFVGSFFEWFLHKYIMHGVLVKGYPYQSHDRIHHQVFDGDHNYYLGERKEKRLVTMAWWNGPALILANSPLPLLLGWLTGSWWVVIGMMLGYTAYYGAYEYLHWCMHVPGPRWFQKTWAFKWIDRHHRIHHVEPMRNLNVVLPIADFILGTRSRIAA